MKKIIKIAMVCLAAGLMLASCAKKESGADKSLEALQKRGVFVLGLDDSFPPLGFRNEKNEIDGFDIDLAKEVAARLGVSFTAQPIEWDAKEIGRASCRERV